MNIKEIVKKKHEESQKTEVSGLKQKAVAPTCRFSASRLRLLISSLVSCINSASISLIWGTVDKQT